MQAKWIEAARVERVMHVTGCDQDEAREYLIAEEGDEADAVLSIRADRRARDDMRSEAEVLAERRLAAA